MASQLASSLLATLLLRPPPHYIPEMPGTGGGSVPKDTRDSVIASGQAGQASSQL